MSNGCTFAPPAIRGFDGSMLAQFPLPDERARNDKNILHAFSLTECDIEKGIAEISPLGFVPAAEQRMVGIGRGVRTHSVY
jgi:hypothetical protein